MSSSLARIHKISVFSFVIEGSLDRVLFYFGSVDGGGQADDDHPTATAEGGHSVGDGANKGSSEVFAAAAVEVFLNQCVAQF